jgi:hypothetical protein
MCGLLISEATLNATFLPVSVGGREPYASRDGLTIDLFGQALVPVSPSVLQEQNMEQMTLAIFGPSSPASSRSAALQSSLENRLRARTDVDGSLEYVLIWKNWDMQSGPPICALRARKRLTSDSGCTGWGTPTAQDARHATFSPSEQRRDPANLRSQVYLAGWATPTARDRKDGAAPSVVNSGRSDRLSHAVHLANQVLSNPTHGPDTTSFNAPTGKRAALNPAHSRWLMGYPTAWDDFAPTVTRLSRK